jgi:hypothetical protein
MLPFIFHPLHELLEAWLAADVEEEWIKLKEKRVFNKFFIFLTLPHHAAHNVVDHVHGKISISFSGVPAE